MSIARFIYQTGRPSFVGQLGGEALGGAVMGTVKLIAFPLGLLLSVHDDRWH